VVLEVAVLQDYPPALPGLEDELGDAEVVGRPPPGEEGRLGQVAPDLLGAAGQRPVERERAVVGPPRLLRGVALRAEAPAVAVKGLPCAAGPVRGVGEPVELGCQVAQRAGLQGVDAALAAALRGDESGSLKGLQVLGRLRLPRAGELGEHADRARPLGQQGHEPPARRVGECGEECVHEHEYSPQRIFVSRNKWEEGQPMFQVLFR
jgi:hypothetical protein